MATATRPGWAIVLLLAALAVAAAGQWSFAGEDGFRQGAVLLGIALALAAAAARFAADGAPGREADRRSGAAPALTCAELGAAQGRTFLATLSLLAGSGSVALATSEAPNLVTLGAWAAGVTLFLAACRPAAWHPVSAAARTLRTHRLEVATVAGIVAVAAVARLYRLNTYPFGVHGDEGEFGHAALRLLSGERLDVFSSQVFLLHPNVYAYLLAGSMQVFGTDVIGARAASGLAGTATVVALYALMRTLFGVRVGLIAAALFALAPWHLAFSRMAMNDVFVPLFLTLAMWGLGRGLQSGALWHYALAGVSAGFGWWMDYNNKSVILCLVLAGAVVYTAAWRWRAWRAEALRLATFAAGVLVVMGPVLATALRAGQLLRFGEIARESSYLLNRPPAAGADWLLLLAAKVGRTLFAFNDIGDTSPFNAGNGTPVFDGLTAIFFVVGLGQALWRWRQPRYGLLLLWWALALAPDVWTVDAPQAHHLLPAIVPAYGLAALGLTRVATTWAAALAWTRPAYATTVTAVVLAVIGGVNATRFAAPTEIDRSWVLYADAGQILRARVQTDTVYFLGPPEVYSGHGAIRFVSHGAVVTDVEDIRAVALPEEPTDHNLYFLFTPGHFPDVAFVQARYPHGTLEQWRDGAEPYLIGYRVAREQDTARRDDAP